LSHLGGDKDMLKLVWLLVGLSFISLFGARYVVGQWNSYLWIPFLLFILTSTIAIYMDRGTLKNILFAKHTKFGVNTLTLVLIFLSFLVGTNFLLFRYNKNFDFSREKISSLSSQTKQYLKSLSSDVTIEAYYVAQDQGRKESVLQLLRLFEQQSPNVKFEFKDPNLFPDLVKANGITESGMIIINYKGKQAKLQDQLQPFDGSQASSIKEEQVINSIIKLSRNEIIEICFTQGHKEKSFDQSGVLGLVDFGNSLEDLSYSVKNLRLIEEEIPSTCKMLAILGPELPFEEGELNKVSNYVKNGGSLFVAMDPGLRHNMARLSKPFDVSFTNVYVVDYEGQLSGSNAALTVGRDYNLEHVISKSFNNTMYSFFPVASYFEITDSNKDLKKSDLFYSSSQSFTQLSLGAQPQLVEGRDKVGPFPIAVAVEGKIIDAVKPAKAVFIADSDFIVDQFYSKYINKDIALNIISYLTDEVDLISIRNDVKPDLLFLTQTKANVLALGFLLVSTALIFTSILLWIRK
jgi:ABC-2 type transport system permease protein